MAAAVDRLRALSATDHDAVAETASSAEVARVYERVGFRRVATGYAAEPG